MTENNLKVLAIDDEEESLSMVKAIVENAFPNVRFFSALTGGGGLAIASAEDPDVILLDIVMPTMDGFEVCRRLKADARLKSIPVVFMTASGTDEGSRVKGLDAGGEGFLLKPLKEAEFLAQIRAMAKIKGSTTAQRREKERLALLLEERTSMLEREVAKHRLMEKILRESEARYRALFEQARDSILMLELPPDGIPVIRDANDAALRMHGYSREELLGKPIAFLDAEASELLIRERVARIRDANGAVFEVKHRRKDGSVFDLEISVREIDVGGKRMLLDISHDITERKQAEAALRESAEDLRCAQRMANIGSWKWIMAADTVQWSEELRRINGYDLKLPPPGFAEMSSFYVPESWKRLNAAVAKALQRGEAYELELTAVRTDGLIIDTLARGEVDYDAGGKIAGFHGTVQDITKRKRAKAERETLRAQLQQSQKIESVGRLAGGVAHDFNNLLTAIIGYAGFLLTELAGDDPKRGDVKEIMNAAERATGLTRQLLAFSRKQILNPQVVDLNAVLGGTVKLLQRLIGEDIKLETDLAARMCQVKVDAGQLDQVIINLAVNARDAMPKGGTLTLRTALVTPEGDFFLRHPDLPHGPLVCLSISDTGCGMTAAATEHMFEPFFTTKEKGKGTGLGLSTVFGIIKQSGGDIDVDSGPDRGTTFRIYFPHIETVIKDPDKGKDKGALLRGTETVLLVEDEESLRRLGERLLRMNGYTVIVAADGKSALEAAERHGKPVDLLMTDVVMPGMNGRELATELARRKLAHRTLFMSGYTEDAIVEHGVLGQGIAFIYKPFTVEALSIKLREVLDGPADKAKA